MDQNRGTEPEPRPAPVCQDGSRSGRSSTGAQRKFTDKYQDYINELERRKAEDIYCLREVQRKFKDHHDREVVFEHQSRQSAINPSTGPNKQVSFGGHPR